ncbi:MAG: tRNA preQ1(34) S-adenosylmethionine ribosyltransferase-isomerase QueA [Verrucomicrobia bacterium]|nr:tRNA preQ1(34) S-adenosylmethionine ribosyltransferase-isomerase QueA [Verrucomicrobiota bacterium]MBI3867721.1 tRNA preQ1(34) S-adenosylmethionine ribosyltransferase-isomerase QueA [Verrucomicrobiota bacterium]
MRTADFHYELPPDLIAQVPSERRDASRLLVLDRGTGAMEHSVFHDIAKWIPPGALLVVNDSKVIPARLRARNPTTGGELELLLLESVGANEWWAMARPGKRAPVGREMRIASADGSTELRAIVTEVNASGHRRLRFEGCEDVSRALMRLGEMPLPPYIARPAGPSSATDVDRYQTVYAATPGSVAAPTAGLHFTPELLAELQRRSIAIESVTLHVGVGTFAPVKSDAIEDHKMHSERYHISEAAAKALNEARGQRRPIIAVGTTSLRVLESAARGSNEIIPAGTARTDIFIYPPRSFRMVGGLITNFHLPQSTLLMLVSAFAAPGSSAGLELVLGAYREAIAHRYRFFSYGDAMFLR